jgi:hypothetical protein
MTDTTTNRRREAQFQQAKRRLAGIFMTLADQNKPVARLHKNDFWMRSRAPQIGLSRIPAVVSLARSRTLHARRVGPGLIADLLDDVDVHANRRRAIFSFPG